MIISYNKKVHRKELILGIIFLLLGIAFVWNEPENIMRFGFILVGLLHLISGIYQLKIPYLRIENDTVKRAGLSPRTIKLSEVEKIKKFAGDYTLLSSEKKLKINSDFLNKDQRSELENLMRSLDIPIDETPAKKYSYKNS